MFSTPTPTISPQDLDLIKKTAFYTSQYSWFTTKHKFTSKGHSLYPLFTSFVEQYRVLLTSPPEPTKPEQVLTRAHEKAQKAIASRQDAQNDIQDTEPTETQDIAEAEEKERIAFAQIDWQNFVILERINFSVKDFNANLPAALVPEDIQKTPLEERGNVISRITAKEEYLVSPFTGEKIKASEYDEHARVMNLQPQTTTPKRQDAESNLYYDDVEANLKNWKKSRLKE